MLLEVEGLTAGYGRQSILFDVDVSFHGGAVSAIIGPNGAGKSTLMKILQGVYRADAGEIVLVLTDVIMPGMNGRDLADKLHERAPELPILYMSGYAGPILGHVLDDGVQVIQKPFTRALLSQKIRETLERR